ncbi:hypothetical protein MPTK1_1g05055 [Marchantia polymorpha subsp. ruderalis]
MTRSRRSVERRQPGFQVWPVVAVGILLWACVAEPVVAQDITGYVSIDCGGTGGVDPVTLMEWVSDDGFLDSERQLVNERVAVRARVRLNSARPEAQDNAEQLKTAMVFVPGARAKSKYCYNLTVAHDATTSTDYLVRAMFPSRALTAEGNVPLDAYGSRFYFTVDSTFVSTIDLDPSEATTVEMVVSSLDTNLLVCLVPLEDRSSMAAISSLELRPLNGTLYSNRGSAKSNTGTTTKMQSSYLVTVARFNFGGNESSPSVRYPSDPYDRLWQAGRLSKQALGEVGARRRMGKVQMRLEVSDDNDTPGEVLETAWEGESMASKITFEFDIRGAQAVRPLPTFFLTMMFLDVGPELDAGAPPKPRLVYVDLVDYSPESASSVRWISGTTVQHNLTTRWYNYKQLFFHNEARFTVSADVNSSLPAMINSAELLGEFDAVNQRTAPVDASAITDFSERFENLVDTAGDPCLPVPWDWLMCSIEIPPRITQINITGDVVAGELNARVGNLSRLTVLDLSNNQFNGSLPESLAQLVTLNALDVANNSLSGELPAFEPKSLKNLQSVTLRSNAFSGSLSDLVNALDTPVSDMDLSFNNFSGAIPMEITNLKNLKSLDLSNNQLSGTLDSGIFNLSKLTTLNLKNNSLEGMVHDDLWKESRPVEVALDDNKFTEINLTTWGQAQRFYEFKQRVSLVRNTIRNVILPSHVNLKNSDRRSWEMLPNQGHILLGGTPWCKQIGRNASLVQRYLCREDERVDFWMPYTADKNGVSTRTLVIIGVACGLLVLLMGFIVFVFMWRVWKRMLDLRQIQEALAKDDVRPPFFKYEELKAATGDFSKRNELGKGAFGAVYKAKLADGSIVAVKRLFATEQNVADFLKEMVLITGIKHRHLVQLKGCCVRDKQRMLVYEYAENNNLAEALWGKDKAFVLTWTQRLNIAVGIARGLSYLHEELQPKIIHRDIKPQNILLDKDWNAKIADFGLARPVNEDATQMATHIGGTLGYFSPEYATLGMFTEKLDVYSYGVLLLEIVSGRRCINFSLPEHDVSLRTVALRLYMEDKLLNVAESGLLAQSPGDEITSVLKTALACVQEDPNKRPSMSQVVNMLTGNSGVAFDIVKELKEQRMWLQDVDDESTLSSLSDLREREDRSLLYSSSSSGGALRTTQLSDMKPR